MERGVLERVKVLFDYLTIREEPRPADIIIGFGVFDMRVPTYCAKLFLKGYANKILFTGGVGRGSGDLTEPEAIAFRKKALELGVPEENIWTEDKSTNTLENVLFSMRLMREKNFEPKSVIIVTRTYLQRRVWFTCRKQMPETTLINCPTLTTFEEEIKSFKDFKTFLARLMGEVERIIKYGEKGDIFKEDLSEEIEEIYKHFRYTEITFL